MRLIVMGQQAFGQAALERLLQSQQDKVVSVYCAPDKAGRPIDPLKERALAAGLPVRQPDNFKDVEVLEQMRNDSADLMIMAYVTIFVPEEARNIPTQGSICFHPSLLPLHRGPSSINWPIINGATKTGFSWFYPTDGLDEGDILLQEECEIAPDDTLGDVYFKKIFPAGVASVDKVCDLFRSGDPPRSIQDEYKSTYESWCRKADVEIDWALDAATVYNLIRGSNPQPGAWTTLDGKVLQIYNSQLVAGKGKVGEVVQVNKKGIFIQAKDGRILVTKVRPEGDCKLASVEWANSIGLKPGIRFGKDNS